MRGAKRLAIDTYVPLHYLKSFVMTTTHVPANHLIKLLTHTLSLPLQDTSLHSAHLKLTTAALVAGDMSLWMGPGRKVLERAWKGDPMFAILLSGSLSDMDWGGWKLIALPHVLRHTSPLLQSESPDVSKYALRLLARLSKEGKLESSERAWKETVGAWVIQRLDTWEIGVSEDRVSACSDWSCL